MKMDPPLAVTVLSETCEIVVAVMLFVASPTPADAPTKPTATATASTSAMASDAS